MALPVQNFERQADAPPVSAVLSGDRRYIRYSGARTLPELTPPNLLLEHFFDLSDLLLNFAGVLFGVAFSL
jgi:hypothetical protein